MMIRCTTFGKMCRAMMRTERTPNAVAACTYSSWLNFMVSARSSRHSVAQPVRPRITHSMNRRTSARSAPVSNMLGWVSMKTCIISTQAAISSTFGIDDSVVYRYCTSSSTQPRR